MFLFVRVCNRRQKELPKKTDKKPRDRRIRGRVVY